MIRDFLVRVSCKAPLAIWLFLSTFMLSSQSTASTILLEAEAFADRGGWEVDTQAMDVMGSPFVLAHGLGVPVKDAVTTVEVPEAGSYRIWVRTRDWVAPWGAPGTPGRFQVLFDGKALEPAFGTEGADWHWQDGGTVDLPSGKASVSLHDLTGFDGRCDAVLLTTERDYRPPNEDSAMGQWRRELAGLSEEPEDAGMFDLVVVGGGMAGCCTAVSAARFGCKVALIQERPMLGGNNSSEVRVGLSGLIHQEPYPRLGDLVDEIGPIGHWNLWEANRNPESGRSKRILAVIEEHPEKKTHNAGPASNYEDDRKLQTVQAENNIRLYLNMHAFRVEKETDRIAGEVLGMAASLCVQHETTPRGVYEQYLDDLQAMMRQGVGRGLVGTY